MPPTLESPVLASTKWLLTLCARRGFLAFTRIHVMPIIRGNGRFSKNIDMAGFADLEIVVPPHGCVGYIETKSTDGRLSDAQEAFRDARVAMGARYCVSRSLDESAAFLLKMGVPVHLVLGRLNPEARRSQSDAARRADPTGA